MDTSTCCSCGLVSGQMSTGHLSGAEPTAFTKLTSVWAGWFRTCGPSQSLSPFLLPTSLSGLLGFPHDSSPRNEVTVWVFFPCIFWLQLKAHVLNSAFRKAAFGTRTAERQPSRAASHYFNGRKACGVQTALNIHSNTISADTEAFK